ncbi:MAG: sulfatase [Planctomycetia bacterium]|nr:sulfatase [Planctomycetia bacterium]
MHRSLLCALFLLSATHAISLSAAEPAPRKMNVLYVVSDDLCNRLACYGDPLAKSPNIDRLAAKGVRFDLAYCQYPLCNPSRASFLTGLRPDHTKIYENETQTRTHVPDVQTLPQTFRKGGYYVARVGKLYHYGVPGGIGTSGLDDPPSWQHVVNPRGRDKDVEADIFTLTPRQFGGTLSWLAVDGSDDDQTDGIGATETIKLLEANQDKPFFIACGFYRPHTPYVATKKFFELYPLDQCAPTEVGSDHKTGVPAAAFGSEKAEQNKLTDALRREAIQAYLASMSLMDAQLGKLLDALERLGLADKTIVVFHSDHGYHLSEHGLWQKLSVWEESARVPLIIYDPRAKGNGKPCRRTVELIDLHPTLAALCDLPAPTPLDGASLKPLLEDPQAAWTKPAFSQVARNNKQAPAGSSKSFMGRSIRTERYRYTEWDEGRQGVQLYDHEHDPKELKNLAEDRTLGETLADLRKRLHASYK